MEGKKYMIVPLSSPRKFTSHKIFIDELIWVFRRKLCPAVGIREGFEII